MSSGVEQNAARAEAYAALRAEAYAANLAIVRAGLVLLTWGNASAANRDYGVCAIKPSGVNYEDLSPEDIVIVDVDTGQVRDGVLRPSSDTPTHLAIYRAFPAVNGVVHTHSHYAVCFAQARCGIPCLGTTHADHFHGDIPCTRPLTAAEVATDYEHNTGLVIAETFAGDLDPNHIPAVVVANHGPFAWGYTVARAVENAIVLEEVARMDLHTTLINGDAPPADRYLIDKHFERKHGPRAYYGQVSN